MPHATCGRKLFPAPEPRAPLTWGYKRSGDHTDNLTSLTLPGDTRCINRSARQTQYTIMALEMLLRLILIMGIALHSLGALPQPMRTRRHADGTFTSDFSRARAFVAMRNIINSMLDGKSSAKQRRQEEDLSSFVEGVLGPAKSLQQKNDISTEDSVLKPENWQQKKEDVKAQKSLNFISRSPDYFSPFSSELNGQRTLGDGFQAPGLSEEGLCRVILGLTEQDQQ
ncbi:hypothetical protein NDU88_010224 [Pleurodeles waltl]|uniref:Glucagon / GIP / secretin / VIP family domain-containing protein n=1 Tax=Pleurodeles waltl TaxID=8319 RepID=A0AAV7Q1C0_PLEWA|nr:hypothetical protein NDU88_010224 [Pleurodeles waltl]